MKEQLRLPQALDGTVFLFRWRGQRLKSHRHTELEANLVRRGTATYLVDGRRCDLAPGTQLWLFPRQDHLLLSCSPDYEMWVLVWKTRLLRRACGGAARALRRQRPSFQFCQRLPSARAARLDRLFGEAFAAQGAGEPARLNVTLAYALLAAWDAHAAHEELAQGLDVHPAVERAARLLRDGPEPAGSAELAHRAGLSVSRLSRIFKLQTGVSLVAYRNRLRLHRFLDLYEGDARPKMLDAALAAGFGSYAQFHRVFRKLMGCGPAQYRKGGPGKPFAGVRAEG